jgi:hypothetical protein
VSPIGMGDQSVFEVTCGFKNSAGYVATALTIIAA